MIKTPIQLQKMNLESSVVNIIDLSFEKNEITADGGKIIFDKMNDQIFNCAQEYLNSFGWEITGCFLEKAWLPDTKVIIEIKPLVMITNEQNMILETAKILRQPVSKNFKLPTPTAGQVHPAYEEAEKECETNTTSPKE